MCDEKTEIDSRDVKECKR